MELKGFVVSSSASQLVVTNGSATVTFTAPAGAKLSILPSGTFVAAFAAGVLTTEPVRVEEQADHFGSGHDGDGH